MKINRNGFTLIELLVVIAIISLLSSVIIANVNTSRKKANTAAALQDIKEIQKALEFYYDKYGYYPVTTTSPSEWSGYWDQSTVGSFIPELVSEGFMKAIPTKRGDVTYNYARVETSGNPGFCVVNRPAYGYVLAAYNLQPITGITTGDDCEKSNIWNQACNSETGNTTYCVVKPK